MRFVGRLLTTVAAAFLVLLSARAEASSFYLNGEDGNPGFDGIIIWDEVGNIRTMNTDCAIAQNCQTNPFGGANAASIVIRLSIDSPVTIELRFNALYLTYTTVAGCDNNLGVDCVDPTAHLSQFNPCCSPGAPQNVQALYRIPVLTSQQVVTDGQVFTIDIPASQNFLNSLASLQTSHLGFELDFSLQELEDTLRKGFRLAIDDLRDVAVPEPATLLLVASGLGAIARRRRRAA
jgi:hypothetical protein